MKIIPVPLFRCKSSTVHGVYQFQVCKPPGQFGGKGEDLKTDLSWRKLCG